MRPRRLLLHKREIRKLAAKVAERGYTLVPLSLYWKDGKAKVDLALAKGRKIYDKREAIRDRELRREGDRAAGASSSRQ
jgi:SsrA-binding protein